MYNILHINSEINWAGGEVQTLNLCKGLIERGHNCIIACPPNSKLSEKAILKSIPKSTRIYVCMAIHTSQNPVNVYMMPLYDRLGIKMKKLLRFFQMSSEFAAP